MSEIQIRAAEPTDAREVYEIFRCPRVYANTLQLPWQPFDQFRERFVQVQPDAHRLVAVVDGRVVGNLGLHLEHSRRRDCAWIGMSVHDDYQGRGVGTALMAAMIELSDGWLALRRIELDVWTDNAPAIHLYEKFGFAIEGTARQYAWRAGELVDAHHMARLRS
jgi:putative acetyltransferase